MNNNKFQQPIYPKYHYHQTIQNNKNKAIQQVNKLIKQQLYNQNYDRPYSRQQ
ncbi:hypothetical protein Glove_19g225 [Diversispora epigaea]|uniref:Uncharacterized protein n=1 Tax=Diversispora epigaea TaxID=1348612 RepID=A0A397JKN5_9GLOM|nr:hypothetical protein Glove_19g225 [Diversispora epigaea]